MEFKRRAEDNFKDTTIDIDEMIQKENDQEKRATLMVLQSINQSLLANTMAITDLHDRLSDHIGEFQLHRDEFHKHATEETKVFNQASGGYKVFLYFSSILQVLILSASAWAFTSINHLTTEIHEVEMLNGVQGQQIIQIQNDHDRER